VIVNGNDLQNSLRSRNFNEDLFLQGINELMEIEELLKRMHIDFSDTMNVLRFDLFLHEGIRKLQSKNGEAQ